MVSFLYNNNTPENRKALDITFSQERINDYKLTKHASWTDFHMISTHQRIDKR